MTPTELRDRATTRQRWMRLVIVGAVLGTGLVIASGNPWFFGFPICLALARLSYIIAKD